MIEASYPYGEVFQRKLLALLIRHPTEVSRIVQPQFFSHPLLVDIARIALEAHSRHPDARLTKTTLYELVRNSLGSRGDKYSRDYKKQIKKVFAVQLSDTPFLLEQAKDFAKETQYREALVRAEHHIGARHYDRVHKVFEEVRLWRVSKPNTRPQRSIFLSTTSTNSWQQTLKQAKTIWWKPSFRAEGPSFLMGYRRA